MPATIRRRVTLLGCSVALIGLGVFFALQNLDTAVKYAGIGGFFVGLAGAAMSVVQFRAARQQARSATTPSTATHTVSPEPRPDTGGNSTGRSSGVTNEAHHNEFVQQGPQSVMNIEKNYGIGGSGGGN